MEESLRNFIKVVLDLILLLAGELNLEKKNVEIARLIE